MSSSCRYRRVLPAPCPALDHLAGGADGGHRHLSPVRRPSLGADTWRSADRRLCRLLGDPDHPCRHDRFRDRKAARTLRHAICRHRSLCAGRCAAVEPVSLSAIQAAAPEILYVGIFSSGVAFVLQVIGQRYTTPSQAAIFLSSEALFGASLAALLLGETMPVTGYAGCALMFIAMLVVELVPGLTRRRLPAT